MPAYEDKRYLSVFAAVQFAKISWVWKTINSPSLQNWREISVFEYGKNCLRFWLLSCQNMALELPELSRPTPIKTRRLKPLLKLFMINIQ